MRHAVRSRRKIWKFFEKSFFSKSIRIADMNYYGDTRKNFKEYVYQMIASYIMYFR